jgi:hypothetical protein
MGCSAAIMHDTVLLKIAAASKEAQTNGVPKAAPPPVDPLNARVDMHDKASEPANPVN